MLRSLFIQNYALIDELDIDFQKGFTIITGETGAGKSILLGALSLILGQRADTSALQDKSRKCVVEGSFDISNYNLKEFFKENDLDYEDITIIRREISERGKSRAFINDTPVNLQQVRQLGRSLVDVHSQHQSLVVGDNLFQLSVLDSLADNASLLSEYSVAYEDYRNKLNSYNSIIERARQSQTDLDYYKFQLKQLNDTRLVSGEQKELEEEIKVLNNAGEIKSALNKAVEVLTGEELSLINSLRDITSDLSKIESYFPKISGLYQRLESSIIELKDISSEVAGLEEKVEFDPSRADVITERLDMIYSLQQKHNVSSVEELIKIRDSLEEKVNEIGSFDLRIEEEKKRLEQAREKLELLAGKLTSSRKQVIAKLEEWMENQLKELGIPSARFVVDYKLLDDYTPYGKDRVNYLFSANRRSEPMELSKVASGGEISRVMLSLKSLVASSRSLPTIIFDEIDAGVSGEIADKMGRILKRMSSSIQLFNITHLPQVAARGDYHYLVYKKEEKHSTRTEIKLLEQKERVREIAKMLSGEGLSDAAMENARELLNSKQSFASKNK